jgi:catechol 2,3-dioxygenase-like lactoylglutathione lyase family enzyme
MSGVRLDHVVIHIDDWEKCNDFYRTVLDAELVENPEGARNPLGAVAYRFGDQQLNAHGPWPGLEVPCCEPPLNEPGRADLCFRFPGSADDAAGLLQRHRIAIVEGPRPRFGANGWGTSIYCRDPSGNSIELICYEAS